jgi:hypothetical protein
MIHLQTHFAEFYYLLKFEPQNKISHSFSIRCFLEFGKNMKVLILKIKIKLSRSKS